MPPGSRTDDGVLRSTLPPYLLRSFFVGSMFQYVSIHKILIINFTDPLYSR